MQKPKKSIQVENERFQPIKKNFPALRNNSPRWFSPHGKKTFKKLYLKKIISRKFSFCVEHSNILKNTKVIYLLSSTIRCSLSRYLPISRCGSIMVTNDVADRGPRPPGMWAQAGSRPGPCRYSLSKTIAPRRYGRAADLRGTGQHGNNHRWIQMETICIRSVFKSIGAKLTRIRK